MPDKVKPEHLPIKADSREVLEARPVAPDVPGGGQAALFEEPRRLLAMDLLELRERSARWARDAHPSLALFRRGAGLICWAMKSRLEWGEYGTWLAGFANDLGVGARTLGEWRSAVEASEHLVEVARAGVPAPPPRVSSRAKSARAAAQREELPAQPAVSRDEAIAAARQAVTRPVTGFPTTNEGPKPARPEPPAPAGRPMAQPAGPRMPHELAALIRTPPDEFAQLGPAKEMDGWLKELEGWLIQARGAVRRRTPVTPVPKSGSVFG